MDDLNLDEPDDDYWYAFGRIAEGVRRARNRYRRLPQLEKPKEILGRPDFQLQACANAPQDSRRLCSRNQQLAPCL